jgi:ACS family hexuronate transporter-like MFS transporter
MKSLRWWMIALLMLGSIINYLTRSTLGVAASTILQDLHITTQQYSWIVGTFQGAIMLQPICGYVLDVVGLKAGFAMFAIAWSLVSMAHGLARSWPAFAVLRGLLGFAEGCANPAGMKATAEWFPAKERGLAGGLFNIGASVGSMLAPPLVVWAILAYNWQAAFVMTGLIGLAWVALWLAFYHSPDRHPKLSAAEREYIVSGQEPHLKGDGTRPSIGRILGQRNFWGIALPRFLADPTWGTLTFWMPLYLNSVRHFDLKQIALFAWMPFLAADLGSMFGGVVSLWLQACRPQPDQRAAGRLHGGRRAHDGHGVRWLRDQPVRGDRAAVSRRLRAPDAVRDGDYDGVRPVQAQRGRHGRRHGRYLRQWWRARVLADHRRAGRGHRLHAVLRVPGGARFGRRGHSVDPRP